MNIFKKFILFIFNKIRKYKLLEQIFIKALVMFLYQKGTILS